MIHFKAKAQTLWENMRFSYWFVPTLMVLLAGVLSQVTIWFDQEFNEQWPENVRWFYSGDAEGARVLLSAIAASMIGIAGVVFSITIVALTLTSSQFGPRLLRNFMRDVGSQIVLGTFTSSFVYCLLVLRTVRGNDASAEQFIPHLSLFTAFLMSLAGLGVLIYFIHHTATVIQAPIVIATVAQDLRDAITEFSQCGQRRQRDEHAELELPPSCESIPAGQSGYVQRIEIDDILEEAIAHDLVIAFKRRPGHYVQDNEPVLAMYPAEKLTPMLKTALQQTFSIAEQRTLAQDPEYAVDQLVEIAVRALSPGINDPHTAMQCIDRLGEGLSVLARLPMPDARHYDSTGKLRLIAWQHSFDAFMNTAFSRVRQSARTSLPVLIRIIDALTRVAGCTCDPSRRTIIDEHGQAVHRYAQSLCDVEIDARALARHYGLLTQALREESPSK